MDFYGYIIRKVAHDLPLNVVHLFTETLAWCAFVDTKDLNPFSIKDKAYAAYLRCNCAEQSADNA
ncbi:hypothetical protein DEIPH_ctg008orf0053 [Deinococcus phoenicis]|uniref:Uncharacterized protein n=1 Tax=Deinococcus phoenicis TaxID=1476583 RepID=A0A016QTD7_9DEIO|nr:hypothetical protein DEIPH_ctg008orf0053 [Deinococcus phoenicis]